MSLAKYTLKMKSSYYCLTKKIAYCWTDLCASTMSEETFENYFLDLSAPIRYVSQIYGIKCYGSDSRSSRWRSAALWIWSVAILMLVTISNVYLGITKIIPHFQGFYVNKEMPVSSAMAIIDRLNKMICVILFHLLMYLTFNQTFKTFIDKLEPISNALGRPDLSRIRNFSYYAIIWLIFSVSLEHQ